MSAGASGCRTKGWERMPTLGVVGEFGRKGCEIRQASRRTESRLGSGSDRIQLLASHMDDSAGNRTVFTGATDQ